MILELVNRKGISLKTIGFVTLLCGRAHSRMDVGCVV